MITSWMMLVKIIFLLFLLLCVFPRTLQVWQDQQDWKDRLLISLIHSHLFFIVVVHLLVVVHVYEMLSIMLVSMLTYYLLLRRMTNKQVLSSNRKVLLSFIQATDHRSFLKRWAMDRYHSLVSRMKDRITNAVKKLAKHYVAIPMILLLFFLSAAIRFHHALNHYYFPSSDPYVHLKWVKLLGANQIYIDGVYPFGFEAIISALHTLFNIDPYYILRFLGPLAGVFLVFTIYYVIRKHRPLNYSMAIFALLIYFISTFQFGFIWRQYSSLSMEYGIIFVLPAIYFFIEYMSEKRMQSLVLSLECFLLTLLIHPYAAICLTIAYIVLFLFSLKQFPILHLLKMVGGFAVTGFIGLLPLTAGLLSGKEFHGESIDFVQSSLNANQRTGGEFSIASFWGRTEYFHLSVFILLALFMFLTLLIFRKKAWRVINPFQMYVAITLALFLFYKAEWIGIPSVMLPYRIEVTLVLLTSISISSLLLFMPKRKLGTILGVVMMASYLYFSYKTIPTFALPKGNLLQYDESVAAYLKIKDEFPVQEWTIISSVEEYPLAIDYGWHYNLTDFILTLASGEELKFPTNDVFLFVEKIPVGTTERVTAKNVTDFSLPKREEILDFYRLPEYRKLLHEKTWYWIEEVQKNHPELLKVYMDTPRFTVYHLEQDPLNPYDVTTLWQ